MENQQSGIKVTVRNNSSRRSINTDNNLFDFFSTLDDAKDSYINPYFLDSIFGRSERFNNVASLLQFLVRNGIEIDENIVLDAEPCLYKGENNADICSICRLSFESDQSVYNLNCNRS